MKRLTFIVMLLSSLCLINPLPAMGSGGASASNSGGDDAAAAQQTDLLAGVENPADVIIHGAYLPPINNYGTELLAFNDLVGKDVGILHWYGGWYFAPSAYRWLPQQIQAQVPIDRRPYLMISWLPVRRNCRVTPPDQADSTNQNPSLYDIVNGYCDGYIRLVAQEIKKLPFTFLIRFAHEMNINAQPWWVGHYNSNPQLYIDAYRRVHDVFMGEGVTNVQWVWAPNWASYPDQEWNSLFNYYPGDAYVDWVGLVAYNWASYLNWPWWSLTDLFDSDMFDHVLPEVACRYAKPVMLETSTVEGKRSGDGTKAAWILDAYQQLDRYPFVKAIVWFNDYDFSDPSKADLRVVGGSSQDPDPWHTGYAYPLPEGNGGWTNAYRTAVARDKYVSHVPPLEDITPPATWCSSEPVITLPSDILAVPGETATFVISAIGLPNDASLSMHGLPPGMTGQLSQDYLLAPWDDAQVRLQISRDASLGPKNVTFTIDWGSNKYERTAVAHIVNKIYRAFLPAVSRSY